MSPVLRERQQQFAAGLIGAALPADLLRPRRGGEPALFEVYIHAYALRLISALRDNYDVLALALGDDGFDELARAYLAAHPSRHPSIRWFGDRLAEFMQQRPDIVQHPALIDLARMDWALRGAFDAPDGPNLTPAALAGLSPEQWPNLRLSPHPSLDFVTLQWSVEPAWQLLRAHERDSGEPEPELPEPQAHEHELMVWRQGLESRWRSIDAAEASALRVLLAGEPFAMLCETLAEQDEPEQAAMRALSYLHQWLTDGVFATTHLD